MCKDFECFILIHFKTTMRKHLLYFLYTDSKGLSCCSKPLVWMEMKMRKVQFRLFLPVCPLDAFHCLWAFSLSHLYMCVCARMSEAIWTCPWVVCLCSQTHGTPLGGCECGESVVKLKLMKAYNCTCALDMCTKQEVVIWVFGQLCPSEANCFVWRRHLNYFHMSVSCSSIANHDGF